MPSINNLEMAAAVSAYNYIEIRKSLFSKKVIYKPTQSPVKVIVQEYSPAEGARVGRLLDMSPEKMADEIRQKGKPATSANGNYRLEACLSDDLQFCALQLFQFAGFSYQPVIEPRFYKGKDVEYIAKLFI